MRIRPTAYTPGEWTDPDPDAVAKAGAAADLMRGRRVAVLTGAGVSTASGIPDYRSPDAVPRRPMMAQEFAASPEARRRYWARNHLGWRAMDRATPNTAHRLLAAWEQRGVVTGLVTQNVDGLHRRAGSRRVVDLHGTYARVTCLTCGHVVSRHALAEVLEARNPDFAVSSRAGDAIEVAPDADAVLADPGAFVMVDCARCGGVLKPDIVFFGEAVPVERVQAATDLVDDADVLLVVGSSLTVMSGLRFVRRAQAAGTPVIIVNRGATRADPLADIKIDGDASQVLTAVDAALTGWRGARGRGASAQVRPVTPSRQGTQV